MAAKKKTARAYGHPSGLIGLSIRVPPSWIGDLDAYVERLNEGRSWPLLSRSDVIRDVMAWAVKTNPKWEKK